MSRSKQTLEGQLVSQFKCNTDLQKSFEALKKENIVLVMQNEKLAQKNQFQANLILWFKRQIFGRKSERRLAEVTNNQLLLGELPKLSEEMPKLDQTVRSYQRGLHKKKRLKDSVLDEGLRFDASVPVEEVRVPNPEIEGLAKDAYEVISQKVTYRLCQNPGSYFVRKHIRDVIKIKSTKKLITAPAPSGVLEKSHADVSLLAGILVDKFRYHLPLYRQHQRLLDSGIMVSRGSLSNWVHRAMDLLEPVYQAMFSSVLQSKVLAMDETPIKASPKDKKMKTAYYWPLYGDQDEVCFVYANTRSGDVVSDTLGAFCGTLLTDGYQAYESFARKHDDITHALCWAHARRKFHDAQAIEPALCKHALDEIQKLYRIEKDLKASDADDASIALSRATLSKPIVEELFAWLKSTLQQRAMLGGNAFSQAAIYAIKRETGLKVFLENPSVAPDTNHIERQIRSIAMGRKNWLFCWTETGARYAGMAQSLISTCKLHGINPYTYLVDVLERIDTHKAMDVHLLTPRLWKKHLKDQPL